MRIHAMPAAAMLVSLVLPAIVLPATAARAASDYLGAVAPEVENPPQVVKTTCASCHGLHGESLAPTYPNLAGQNYGYLLKQLEDFRSGARSDSAIMTEMIKLIPEAPEHQNLKRVAAYYAGQPLVPAPSGSGATALSASSVKLGYQIYAEGQRDKQVPACGACHMMDGRGNAPMAIPALAAQHASYVQAQLTAFASGKRSNSPNGVMQMIAGRLGMEQIEAIAAYVNAMQPPLLPGSGPMTYETYDEALKTQVVPGIAASSVAPPKSD